MRAWVNDIEPRLIEPTFVYDYPSSQAAFATVRGEIAERFELYMNGVELANAFTELLDSTELLRRWESNNAARKASGQEPHPIDERVVAAVATRPQRAGSLWASTGFSWFSVGALTFESSRYPAGADLLQKQIRQPVRAA